jgi:hypothetical protein
VDDYLDDDDDGDGIPDDLENWIWLGHSSDWGV